MLFFFLNHLAVKIFKALSSLFLLRDITQPFSELVQKYVEHKYVNKEAN